MLEIAHQGKLAIGLTPPTKPESIGKLCTQSHSLLLLGKTGENAALLNRQAQIVKRLNQHILLAEHGWQDGEMGHGPTPVHSNVSEHNLAIQWPLPQVMEGPLWPGVRVGVLASGSGSNFEALVQACNSGQIAAQVCHLVVNNAGCGAQERAKRLGIPCTVHDHRRFSSREALDQALIESFRGAAVDLVVMAGWMRIVTQQLIDAFPERLINIHPSLLPSFRGARAIEQALAAGVAITGCTAHLVSLEVDTGPILVQAAVPVMDHDTPQTLAARIHRQEHQILPWAVQLAAKRLELTR